MKVKWWRSPIVFAGGVAAAVAFCAPIVADASHQAKSGGPRRPVTIYGQTVWNLEALLHDTFGNKTTCLRWRDYAFVSVGCRDLAHYGYWRSVFVGARHSRFKLVRRALPPIVGVGGNIVAVKVRGAYVYCGDFPRAFPTEGEGNPTRRWLVVLHGWAMTPFTCLG